MKRFVVICALTMTCAAVVAAQAPPVPSRWLGAWALSVPESEPNQFWLPGGPKGLTLTDQILEMAATPRHLKVAIETATAEQGSSREEFDFALDGKEAVSRGGERLSFKRIDDRTFDILISTNKEKLGSHVSECHFVFSGRDKLTETTTHTDLEVASADKNQAAAPAMKTSTSILVFYRVAFVPRGSPTRFRNLNEQSPL